MYDMDKEKFGAFVTQLRKEQGMTQKELAKKVYVSDKAVSKWERGLSMPDITLLIPLSQTLGITVMELLECQALLQIIFEKHSFQFVNTLRSSLEIQNVFVLTQTLQEFTGDECVVFYSGKDVTDILSNLNIDTLQEIHEKFTSNKWTNTDEYYTDEDYITNYLKNMDGTNLLFLYHNADCLCLYYDVIEFILKQLVYVDTDKLKKEYEKLKKKRIYGSIGECFLSLNALKYEPPSEPVTEEMVIAIEHNLSDFPEM